ncbi:uncharacterized protein zbtb4 [Stigmatopora nigra]
MVSGVKVWDPFHAGLIHPGLREPDPVAWKSAPSRTQGPACRSPASSSPVTPPTSEEGEEAEHRPEMKGKRQSGRGEGGTTEERPECLAEGAKNAKITLSFPSIAGPLPPSLTSSGYCRSPGAAASSSSPHRRRPPSKSSDQGSLWKLDSTMDVKHRPFKPPRREASPSSSPSASSPPANVHPLIRKEIKSPPPLKCSKLSPETPFLKSVPEAWDKMANGTQTAQILFGLGASAYQRGGGGDTATERKERTAGRPGGKLGSPPLPPPPPLHLPPSSGGPSVAHSSPYSPSDNPKPELICAVCHRLFSSPSSLTVHMRLHRGSRALACRSCGKVFIHGKRLQSHEATCGAPVPTPVPVPPLAVRPKEEPLEEGELRPEDMEMEERAGGGAIRGDDDAGASELLAGDDSHFVKVVDGNVIYFCSVCERSYMTLSSLKRHSNVHSWRRRYPCHYCDKVFALAEYRTKHEVWHTGERRYQCIFCWDAFATYYNLKTHQKTIHGINPSLISSEKTANGGYKQKANALKLYRLLPMRSQKRPYKTYSDNLHNGLLMSPSEASSLSLPGLGCALGGGDLHGFVGGAHPQGVKPDPDGSPDNVLPVEEDGSASLHFPQMDPQKHDRDSPEPESLRGGSKMSASGKTKIHRASRCAESTGNPSVITYGHPKASVIVHGTAMSSSVIVHSNQVSPGGESDKLTEDTYRGGAKSVKRQRGGAEGHRKRPRESLDPETDGSYLKSRKSHPAKTKQPSPSVGSPVKEAGPLCQITVRIGEEAIVKRSISETDLRRDKSRSPPKSKKGEASSVKGAHHHKHHGQRKSGQERSPGDAKGEEAESTGNSSDELREYNFRHKVRQQESDHDGEDNLWRPYYSYKPKKKAQAQVQRFKSWQRKLKLKRALRLKRRAEKLKKRGTKDKKKEEEEEEPEKPPETEDKPENVPPVEPSDNSPPSPKPPVAVSVASPGLKRQTWTNGEAAECSTCGCWFSSSNKRDQHELGHLLEFVCLFCRATFPSRDKLEDHQRMEHPKPADAPTPASPKAPIPDQDHVLKPEGGDKKEDQVKLSRRALSRHTCPRCHKVCKTSSALNRHLRRHQFGSSPEGAQDRDLIQAQTTTGCQDLVPEKGQGVSVISYSTAEPPKSSPGEPPTSTRQAKSGEDPQTQEPSPKISCSPMNLAPGKAQHTPAPPTGLQSVLVMNKPECLDYRTAGKRNLETMASPLHSAAAASTRITTAAPPVSTPTVNSSDQGGVATRDGVIMDREQRTHAAMFAHTSYKEPNLVQDLRVKSLSRSPSPIEAQDLTMSSILAREREMERQRVQKREVEKQRERGRDKDGAKNMEKVQHPSVMEHTIPVGHIPLLVPKEEPVSPVPSPQHIPTPSPLNGPPSHRHTPKSPCRPGHLASAKQQVQELERHPLPMDRPSAHALLLPRAPKAPQSERQDASGEPRQVEAAPVCYPVQDYPLPLVAPDSYPPAKKQDDNLLVSAYPTGALPFGPLGKMMIPNGADLAKLPFYPDPYQLLYGSQLLAYPYNVATLPMALNMMAPGTDKVEPLPFLPAIFNYTAGAGPYVGAAPHPLVANPSFYGGGKKQRDGGGHKQ